MKEEAILLNNPELRLYLLYSLIKQLQPYISETITLHRVVPSHYTTCTNCSSYDKSSSSIFSFFSSVFSWAFQEQVFFHFFHQFFSWAFQEQVFFHFFHHFFPEHSKNKYFFIFFHHFFPLSIPRTSIFSSDCFLSISRTSIFSFCSSVFFLSIPRTFLTL